MAENAKHLARRGSRERISDRKVQAFELRRVGWPIRRIAQHLGWSASMIRHDIAAELAVRRQHIGTDIEAIRTMEVERCHGVMTAMWPRVQQGDTGAAAVYLKASERVAYLLGLDAPIKVTPTNLTGTEPYQPVDLARYSLDELHQLRALLEKGRD